MSWPAVGHAATLLSELDYRQGMPQFSPLATQKLNIVCALREGLLTLFTSHYGCSDGNRDAMHK